MPCFRKSPQIRDLTIEEVRQAGQGRHNPPFINGGLTKATLVLAMLCERMAPNLEKPTVLTAGRVSAPSGAALDRRLQRAIWQDRGRADRRGPEPASYSPRRSSTDGLVLGGPLPSPICSGARMQANCGQMQNLTC